MFGPKKNMEKPKGLAFSDDVRNGNLLPGKEVHYLFKD